jgi:hypothetical protein
MIAPSWVLAVSAETTLGTGGSDFVRIDFHLLSAETLINEFHFTIARKGRGVKDAPHV